jgi:hypothetical protein
LCGLTNTLRVLARLLDHFGMSMRSLFVCSALLLFASVAYGAGSYQRTRDGKTLVWNDSPKRGEEATWSGKRDKNGFAAGSGTLTWYKVQPTIVTGSQIPDTLPSSTVIQAKWCEANSRELSLTSMPMEKDCRRPLLTAVRGR